MLADFGQPRAGGQMRWDGVLIAAPAGTEVRTIRPGKVVYADWLPGLGLLLVWIMAAATESLRPQPGPVARCR